MNITRISLVTIVAWAAFSGEVMASDASRKEILLERERVLSEIVRTLEARSAVGTATEAKVSEARIALFEFRRDASTANSDRIRFQAEIVKEREGLLKALRDRKEAHPADPIEVLYTEDRLLAARQLLAEMTSADGD